MIIATSQGPVEVRVEGCLDMRATELGDEVFYEGNCPNPNEGTQLYRSLSVGDWFDYPITGGKHMRVWFTDTGFSLVPPSESPVAVNARASVDCGCH